jgi:four helix bundle protein
MGDMNYQQLDVWKVSIDLTETIHRTIRSFPPEERFSLTEQLRRASISIPLNIAEGSARTTSKEFVRFLDIARGSLREVETCLVLASRFGYLNDEHYGVIREQLERVGRMLTALRRSLKQS